MNQLELSIPQVQMSIFGVRHQKKLTSKSE
ncbi:hypothetical protein HNR53_003269 [Bacillus benzoevorans]|uniref:Uncharacterized protein n=1 Tax=Bacillus benzoevorans TaxID=1456 RepID=A0A7X0LXN5_9BACI|nr:hypothetical protein [Bacillus benzoevorans]